MPDRAKTDTVLSVAGPGTRFGARVGALLAVVVAAKVALWGLRIHDGAAPAPSAWLPLALLHEDFRLVTAFAVMGAPLAMLAGRARRAHPRLGTAMSGCGALLYIALLVWTAGNVPVARALSSPLTSAMLYATGTAITDSIGTYVTPLNLGIPLALIVAGAVLPSLSSRRAERIGGGGEKRARWYGRRRAAAIGAAIAATAAAAMLLGPYAVRRTDLSGWHRNAVLTLLRTSLASGRSGRAALPSLDSDVCRPADPPAGPAHPLADLAGLVSGRNIVWIVLESTGARALGAYGATTGVTPQLDALARDAVVFENAYAGYPESIKGLYAYLCARLPPAGVEAASLDAGRAPCPTAAAALTAAGWTTGLFHSGWFAYLGMRGVVSDRGFGTLVDAGSIDSPLRTSFGVDDRATATRVLAFVDALPPGQRFFAAFMPIAGHHPYHAPSQAPRPVPEHDDHDAYLNEMAVADDAVGLLRDGFKTRGLDARTVYIVVGDHGEAFREHPGNIAHALYVYEENVRIPFFIAAPGALAGQRRVPAPASLIDLSPTTVALAGVPVPPKQGESSDGQSLLAGRPRVARFFTDQGVARWGLRDGRWKLIWDADADRARLFDLTADPGETRDQAAAHPDLVARYLACLGRPPA
jgi:lipoteichoic acid synthase